MAKKGLLIGIFLLFALQSSFSQKKEKKEDRLRFYPVAIYTPENGFGFGGVAIRQFKEDTTYTRTSYYQFATLYTTTNRFLVESMNNIFLDEQNWFLLGYTFLFKFPDLYYGIGNNTPASNEEEISYLVFDTEHQGLRRIAKSQFYFGLVLHYVNQWNMKLEPEGILESSMVNGYEGSSIFGLGPAFLFDNRDNIGNPYRGWYVSFLSKFYNDDFLSQYTFSKFVLDSRKYLLLSKENRIVLALQGVVTAVSGDPTFSEYALLGGQTLMRGYYKGRFRDTHAIAAQAEVRIPVWKFLGVTAFGGMGEVGQGFGQIDISNFKYSYGLGLRVMINKNERTNIRIDYGMGKDTNGFYFGVLEAF